MHNLSLLASDEAPIIFLEPSCYSMFAEDYRELNLPGAAEISARCYLFEDFIESLLGQEPEALKFDREKGHLAIHSHCHAKALTNTKKTLRLATRSAEPFRCGVARCRLLWHGRRLRHDGLQIRVIAQDRRTAHRKAQTPAVRHHRELPAPVAVTRWSTSPRSASVTWPKSSPKPWLDHQPGTKSQVPKRFPNAGRNFENLNSEPRFQKPFWIRPLTDQCQRRLQTPSSAHTHLDGENRRWRAPWPVHRATEFLHEFGIGYGLGRDRIENTTDVFSFNCRYKHLHHIFKVNPADILPAIARGSPIGNILSASSAPVRRAAVPSQNKTDPQGCFSCSGQICIKKSFFPFSTDGRQ